MIVGLIKVAKSTGEIAEFSHDRTLKFDHSNQKSQYKDRTNEDKFSGEDYTGLVVPECFENGH